MRKKPKIYFFSLSVKKSITAVLYIDVFTLQPSDIHSIDILAHRVPRFFLFGNSIFLPQIDKQTVNGCMDDWNKFNVHIKRRKNRETEKYIYRL